MIITISGQPGAGKSTTAELLSKKLDLKHYSIGDLMRSLAKKKGMTLEELSQKAEQDPSIDKELDQTSKELGKKEDNFVIDTRLGFHFIPDSIKIFLKADLKERAKRIYQDERKGESFKNIKEAQQKIKQRQRSEVKRYQKYYNFNPYKEKHYDLVIDTTDLKPEEVLNKIIDFLKEKNL